jgi:mannose-6-phosphate isomerase
MNFEKVSRGDVYYMPAGRVHALGPGILLTEIQQTSDVTYRIYDWDRIDKAGMMRELHTEEALDAIDFQVQDQYSTPYDKKVNETVSVVESPHFTTNLIHLDQAMAKDYSELDSFVIYVCPEGNFKLKAGDEEYPMRMGEAILLPASLNTIEIHPAGECKILEVFMMPNH